MGVNFVADLLQHLCAKNYQNTGKFIKNVPTFAMMYVVLLNNRIHTERNNIF